LTGCDARRQRLDQVWHTGLDQLDTRDFVWLAVAMVPDYPGDMRLDRASYQRFQATWMSRDPGVIETGSQVSRTSVGQGFLHPDGAHESGAPLSTWMSIDLHTDGSGFFALPVGRFDETSGNTGPDDELIALSTLSALVHLARHARDTAADGAVSLRACIHVPSEDMPVRLTQSRNWISQGYGQQARTKPVVPMESAVPLDVVADGGVDLPATAAVLVHRLGHAFGVPELVQLSHEGEVRIRYFGQGAAPRLRIWSETNRVPLSEESLDE
jgi:hypothetical protein